MQRGVGYAGEGDAFTASLVGALLKNYKETSFVEIFCPDWKNDALFISHMGEMNYAVADREIELLREAYNNAIPKYVDEKNGGQEFKVNRNLYSRAEILAAMEALGKAMEYYDQVNGTKY